MVSNYGLFLSPLSRTPPPPPPHRYLLTFMTNLSEVFNVLDAKHISNDLKRGNFGGGQFLASELGSQSEREKRNKK
ncbi:hypothetical protein BLOT_003383 [Blomia tropicalis]|nr:hypothetical protein BLOT_003383 [Blomia tropicalis]